MIALIIAVVVNSGLLYVTARFVPGIYYEGGIDTLIVAGALLSLINVALRQVFQWIQIVQAFFYNLISYLFLNTLLLVATAHLVHHFQIVGMIPPLLGGILFGLFNLMIALAFRKP